MESLIEPLTRFLMLMIVPLNLGIFLVVLAVVVGLLRWRILARVLLAFGVSWVVLWSLPITSLTAGQWLEQRYEVDHSAISNADAMVVLGGHTAQNRLNWFVPLSDGDAVHRRVDTAFALFEHGKAPIIIVSGAAYEGDVSEAQGMAWQLRQLGVPESAILIEEQSHTTRENAVYTQQLMQQQGLDTLLVVTSALHMPRAMGVFKHLGVNAYAAPNPPQVVLPPGQSTWFAYLPNRLALASSRSIIKEYLGYWVYQWRGWIE